MSIDNFKSPNEAVNLLTNLLFTEKSNDNIVDNRDLNICNTYLNYQSNNHKQILNQLKIISAQNIIHNSNNDAPQRIKFHSNFNNLDINKLLNLSLFNFGNDNNNLYNKYNEKKKFLIKQNNTKQSKITNFENFNIEENNNQFKNKKCVNNNKSYDYNCGGSYMDIKPVYCKRKNKNNYDDNEEDNDEEISTGYSNSIYNINKKKKKNNNYQKNKKKKNKYISEEDEEEENYNHNNNNDNDDDNKFSGFKTAFTITNKVLKNNKISSDYLKDKNENNKSINRKFVPPKKNSESEQKLEEDKDKEKELDEKLKGFDIKMIEFIESEILSTSPNVKWDDIAGLDFAKKTIKEIIIWPLMRPDLFNGIRRPPKGLLLFGPPGTGKTMIAKAIASESNSHFFNISASSLMSKWVGESEKLVRTLFALASYYQPSVVFIDEIDSLLTSRQENEGEASRRIKTEFLVQLDGAGTNADDRILIIGATNRPQEIDDAFIRRLSKRLYIPLPNQKSRKQLILNVLNKEKEKNNKYDINDDDINYIVTITKGYSGSDLMNVCREAAMMPLRTIEDISKLKLEHIRGVNKSDFINSINTVKPSVSDKTIDQYVQWNKDFGSFQFEDNDE